VRNPPSDLGVVERFVEVHSSESVPGELAGVGYNSAELFGAMVMAAGRRLRSHFGHADDAESFDQQVRELTQRLDEPLTLISRTWTADDIEHAHYDQQSGRTLPPTFKGTPVCVTPPHDSGNRLLSFLEAERVKRLEAHRAARA
jgi:hypothetical protein